MDFIKTLVLERAYVEKLQNMLDSDSVLDVSASLEICNIFKIDFNNGIEVKINLCGSNGDVMFIDPTLLDHGVEKILLNARHQLLGEYVFEYNKDRYIVKIEDTLCFGCNKCIMD